MQADNPFVNAGIFYVQNVRPGDASAWFLEELNRRIARFTYHPETVTQLPSSGWSTPPHFANADEQANMNDIVASGLLGRDVYGNGVEFYEALTLSLTTNPHPKPEPPPLSQTLTPSPEPEPEP